MLRTTATDWVGGERSTVVGERRTVDRFIPVGDIFRQLAAEGGMFLVTATEFALARGDMMCAFLLSMDRLIGELRSSDFRN